MIEGSRRYFQFTRLYYEVLKGLSTPFQKAKLIEAICLYGFDHTDNDFSDDEQLQKAWNAVKPELSFSWSQSDQGRKGGVKSALNRDKNKTNKPPKDKVESLSNTVPFPDWVPCSQDHIMHLNELGLSSISDAPKPLSPEQINWYIENFGLISASCIIWNTERLIEKESSKDFWTLEIYCNKSVSDIVNMTYKNASINFTNWLSETFPNVANISGKYRFQLYQYTELCAKYGKANVAIKLKQLNDKKSIYVHSPVAKSLEAFIESSINKNKGSRFYLPTFDNSSDTGIEGCSYGYDRTFHFYYSESYKIK